MLQCPLYNIQLTVMSLPKDEYIDDLVATTQESRRAGIERNRSNAMFLLPLGTFFEYFDMMLYIHMASVLDTIFFAQTDEYTRNLVSAFSFCSTFLMRPFGAILFGWMGDNYGRKTTVIVTTSMMAFSCILIATLPTYAQIGILASYGIILCRVVQGLACMAEAIGAEVYLAEVLEPKKQAFGVAVVDAFTSIGGFVALGFVSLVLKFDLDWRVAFWIGLGIAIVGIRIRSKLNESRDFEEAKRLRTMYESRKTHDDIKDSEYFNTKIDHRISLAFFAVQCSVPIWYYYVYIYGGRILAEKFHFTSEQIVHQSFIVSIWQVVGGLLIVYFSRVMDPFKNVKIRSFLGSIMLLYFPIAISNLSSAFELLVLQCIIVTICMDIAPASAICMRLFPVLRRFTYSGFIYALSRSLLFALTSFGTVFVTEYLGHYGLFVFIVPMIIAYYIGLNFLESTHRKGTTITKRNHPAHNVNLDLDDEYTRVA